MLFPGSSSYFLVEWIIDVCFFNWTEMGRNNEKLEE